MTDEVAAPVLRNNYQQTLAISLAERRGVAELGSQRLMRSWRRGPARPRGRVPAGRRGLASAARGEALTRPEIAVLLAYAKIALLRRISKPTSRTIPISARELVRYFPLELRERFADAIKKHRLRREIIATELANAIINRGGPTLVAARDRTGATRRRPAPMQRCATASG